jgi:hypothetical protein
MKRQKRFNKDFMQIKQAKEYYTDGLITGFNVVKQPMSNYWVLSISGKNGKIWILETALGQDKAFASLDTLIGEVESITKRVTSLKISI